MEFVHKSFYLAPSKYKVDLTVSFDDFEGYTDEDLYSIFKKNMVLSTKGIVKEMRMQDMLALSLCVLGFIIIFISILVSRLWKEGGLAKEIVAFLLEILSTVPFWSACDIYFVGNGAFRRKGRNYAKRFHGAHFIKENSK